VSRDAPRFIGYLRVSTAEQADSGLGLEAQEHAIREAATRRGWDLTHVYRDAGRTGANLKRKGIKDALRTLAQGKADGIVVAKLDRVSRSSADTALLLDWCANEARVDFVALDVEWADTTTPQGKLMMGLLALLAEHERDLTAQRTRAALAALKAQGKPTGPGSVSDNTQLASHIRRLRDSGLTLQQICSRLEAEGVPTPRGGKTWRPSSLQTVLGWQRPPKRRARAALPHVARGRR
jgi:DNA invertase Pin-like site-specific DNA recombinase